MERAELEAAVRGVIDAVRERGDEALCELTERWDRVRLAPDALRVPESVIAQAPVVAPFAAAFSRAAERIRRFHAEVRPRSITVDDDEGVRMGLRWTPVRAVGLYIPGGKASYPSTLAMTAIPAQIAGVERIAVASPPGPDGEVSPEVLVAARLLGLSEVYRLGGAQAIAALALGTPSVPRVDKIFGPGNAFVAEAKKQLYGEVGIDLLAGPSELVVYADRSTDPRWVAADLMAQAEHDESTRVTLLARGTGVLDAVKRALEAALSAAPRRAIIEAALARNGAFEVVASHEEAARRIDVIAPEHLSLQVEDPERVLVLVRNAGAIFLGASSPVAVGDYYAGPNHVLPTGATARFASSLSVEDFMKRTNVVAMGLDFLRRHGEDVEVLAASEGLPAHAASVAIRRAAPAGPRLRPGLRDAAPYVLVEEDAEVKLNQNESPWDVPDELKEEVASRLAGLAWNRYHQRLPQEFLARLAAATGHPEDGIVAASGSNLILQWIFEAFGGRGAPVLCPSPSFSLYALWGEVSEATLETVRLDQELRYDADAFERAIEAHRPSLTVLCLPNNPTGTELATSEVRRLAAACARAGGVLAIDEAYREFSAREYDRSALARELENVILVRTFSKAFAAAGMRIGYVLAPPALAAGLRTMAPPFHLNLFAAVFGMVVLEERRLFEERVEKILAERTRFAAALGRIPGVDVLPSHANFFLMRVRDAGEVYERLKEKGILVRAPGSDPLLAGCLRVSVGTPEENDRLVAALERGGRSSG
jgi:histidinol dehydrogenase